MKIFCLLSLFLTVLIPLPALAVIGLCASGDDRYSVAITAHDDGSLLDLAVTVDETGLSRFPEANGTKVTLPAHRYKFTVKKKSNHGALDLDITGKKGTMKFGGRTITLECGWQ